VNLNFNSFRTVVEVKDTLRNASLAPQESEEYTGTLSITNIGMSDTAKEVSMVREETKTISKALNLYLKDWVREYNWKE
jgi:hypothetical protein